MEDLSDTTAGMAGIALEGDDKEEDDEEEVQEFPPLAREASTPNIERILQELSLLNQEDKKEVFFGLQKLLADDGFHTVIRKFLPENLCKHCSCELKADFRRSGVGLCKQCLPAYCTIVDCNTLLKKDWRFGGKCREHGGYAGIAKK